MAAAATEANLPDVPEPEVMTPEEEAIQAPTPGEEAKAPEEPKKEEPQTVPLAVHIRQREKQEREARELRNQLAAMQESFRRGEERLTQLTQMLTPTQQAPDPNTDVLGHMVYQQQEAKKQLDALNARLTQQDTEARSRQELERCTNYVISDEKQFEQQAPDYKEAVNFAKGVKLKEYLALGLDQQQAAARVQQDALAIATHEVSQGASPSEFVYRLAQALGYQPKAIPTPTDTPTPTPQDNVIATTVILTKLEQGYSTKTASKNINFSVDYPNTPIYIHVDIEKIEWVLDQLMDNAYKFTPHGGVIRVSAIEVGGLVTITIIDNGIGIPQDKINEIFQLFYQLDSSNTRRYQGTGLGLAFVHRILDAHRSQITVESEVGLGSRFQFSLPIVGYTELSAY